MPCNRVTVNLSDPEHVVVEIAALQFGRATNTSHFSKKSDV